MLQVRENEICLSIKIPSFGLCLCSWPLLGLCTWPPREDEGSVWGTLT